MTLAAQVVFWSWVPSMWCLHILRGQMSFLWMFLFSPTLLKCPLIGHCGLSLGGRRMGELMGTWERIGSMKIVEKKGLWAKLSKKLLEELNSQHVQRCQWKCPNSKWSLSISFHRCCMIHPVPPAVCILLKIPDLKSPTFQWNSLCSPGLLNLQSVLPWSMTQSQELERCTTS